jgi:AcrR family transcriptional regulator
VVVTAEKAARRRGAALECAILDAAWEELVERGYTDFTLEGVAARAGTSRPVLGRRWSGRAELARAALVHHRQQHAVIEPDLGSVREDLASLLQQLSKQAPILAIIVLNMRDYFVETNSSLTNLRSHFGSRNLTGVILQRGVERGEIDPGKLTPRITALPIDLLRHEVLMTMKPMSASAIYEIIDEIFLPLVRK